jgi:hypothetical protein
MYTIGAVVGQLPFIFLFTKLPMSWMIPFMDVAWGIFTLVQYRANSYAELAAYRFLVGWFEVSIQPSLPLVRNQSILTGTRRVSSRECITYLVIIHLISILRCSKLIHSRLMVPQRRNCPSRRMLLRRSDLRHFNSQSNPSGRLKPIGRRQRTRRMALDVHHLRNYYTSSCNPRLLHSPRFT